MAFPTIQTTDTATGHVVTNTANWTLTYPTNIAAGDLLLALVSLDGNAGATVGFDGQISGLSGANGLTVAAKVAAGTETGTFGITNNSEQGAWAIYRITGWFGGTLSGTLNSNDGLQVSAGATGTTQFPDPPNFDPSTWATEDTLWFAVCGVDTSRTISVFPLADNNYSDPSGGAGGATLGVCTLNDAVSAKNPGQFTISASDDWAATTIAVRPAAAGTVYQKTGVGVVT